MDRIKVKYVTNEKERSGKNKLPTIAYIDEEEKG